MITHVQIFNSIFRYFLAYNHHYRKHVNVAYSNGSRILHSLKLELTSEASPLVPFDTDQRWCVRRDDHETQQNASSKIVNHWYLLPDGPKRIRFITSSYYNSVSYNDKFDMRTNTRSRQSSCSISGKETNVGLDLIKLCSSVAMNNRNNLWPVISNIITTLRMEIMHEEKWK